MVTGQGSELTTKYSVHNTILRLGGYIVGVPPLPIPNREVKPYKADGTAVKGGRVSRRHNLFPVMNGIWKNVETQIEKPHSKDWGFFLSIMKRYVFYSLCMN